MWLWIPSAKSKFVDCKFAANAPKPNSRGLLWQCPNNLKEKL
jgi:hypothetical protein